MEAYKKTIEEVRQELQATSQDGLTQQQASERLEKDGRNRFEEAPKESMVKKILHSLSDFTTIVLLVAAAISFYTAVATDHGDLFEGILIIAIVIINSVLAIVQEGNAEKALAALQDMNKQTALVIRGGQLLEIDAEEVVVGDTLVIENGSMIVADARIIKGSQLRVEESALTGESEPVEKEVDFVATQDENLGDQINMLF